jgi:hypothetical protein
MREISGMAEAIRSMYFVGWICGTKWIDENGSDASPYKKLLEGCDVRSLVGKEWGMRCLSLAMFACVFLSAEAAMKKRGDSEIARAANRAGLTRQMSIIHGQKYKHKSEAEIVGMTPAQRVDEWVNEQVHHRYDVLDRHRDLLRRYITADGLKALPRMIEIMDEYDPTRFREGKGRRGERFDACWLMFIYIDRGAVRLRGSEEGRRAMLALDQAIQRMRAAGYGQKGQDEWAKSGRFDLALMYLQEAKGVNETDRAIKDTFRLEHKVLLSDEELLAFSNFLIARDPTYPGWSETNYFRDYTQINEAGYPLWVYTMKKPERFYEAYLEFKKTKR